MYSTKGAAINVHPGEVDENVSRLDILLVEANLQYRTGFQPDHAASLNSLYQLIEQAIWLIQARVCPREPVIHSIKLNTPIILDQII